MHPDFLSPLLENKGIGAGGIVDVTGNPLSATTISDTIPQLKKKGVTIRGAGK